MRGALTQLQVVHALLLRETKTRFGSNQLGYVWAFVEPLLWIGLFALGYRLFGRLTPPGLSVIGFLATGIVPFSLFRDTAQRCMSAIEANKGLLFYPQVRPLDLVIARALLEGATHVIVMVLLMGGVAIWEGPPHVDSWLETIAGFALALGLGASLGLFCCGLTVFSPAAERLFPSFIRVVFWASALFHPVESLPTPARDALLFNPVVHAIELTRDGWFPGYGARHVDAGYVGAWILVFLFFGLTLERMARRRLEVS